MAPYVPQVGAVGGFSWREALLKSWGGASAGHPSTHPPACRRCLLMVQWYAALGTEESRYILYKDTTLDPLHG